MSFERCATAERQQTLSHSAKAGVRSKGRRAILNGGSSKHGPVLKKKKIVKSRPSPSQTLDSVTSVDDEENVIDKKLSSEFVSDDKKSRTSPSAAEKDSETDSQQLHQAAQSTDLVRLSFISASLIR